MKRIINTFAVVFTLVLAFSACAAPPLEEMQKAQDAVTRAENDADAVTYAGNLIIRARDALTRMQSEADSKRYDTAKEFAAEAINNAERAISEGQSAKERSKTDAAALLDSLQSSLAETQNALNRARDVPNIILDFNDLSNDLNEAHKIYNEARQDFQVGNNLEAVEKGQSVRALLSDIDSRISGAAFETSRKQ